MKAQTQFEGQNVENGPWCDVKSSNLYALIISVSAMPVQKKTDNHRLTYKYHS